jgi:Transcriptional regulator, AbiEi antitoxin, Type IV TA system/Transcriptional regulator, AbiEi antitoxin N-terminal domain
MDKPTKALLAKIPDGLIVSRQKLQEMGFHKPAIDYFLRSGKLVSVSRGVYRRPGPPLKWEHFVYSAVQLGHDVHVGGRSALDLLGFAHYLPLGGQQQIHLYDEKKLPSWLTTLNKPIRIVPHQLKIFTDIPAASITKRPFGHWDWSIPYASAELALLELLNEVKNEASFRMADTYFEAATTLRPKLLNQLLSTCKKVHVNRLFLWFARRHDFQHFDSLNLSNINIGKGKRLIVRGGSLDKEFQITVPKEMADGTRPDFF